MYLPTCLELPTNQLKLRPYSSTGPPTYMPAYIDLPNSTKLSTYWPVCLPSYLIMNLFTNLPTIFLPTYLPT